MANSQITTAAVLIVILWLTDPTVGYEQQPATTAAGTSNTLYQQFPPVNSPFPAPPIAQPQQQQSTVAVDSDDRSFIHTALLAPILSHLGYNELAMAVPSLSSESTATAWSGPSTLFAPSDASLHSCYSCSVPSLLREHIVPGLFTIDYLRKLAFGTKVETLSPGRCITVTSSSINSKIFVGGVEITHPDLFNNGFLVIHGIQGYIAPLSPFSCDVERLSSLMFPFQQPSDRVNQITPPLVQPAVMRLMMRDAILRLRNNGFSILALAMRVKYPELVALTNMTIFALDDFSIFSGSYSYVSSVRFHIVPNQLLSSADLERLPVGCQLPTLESGQYLVVTTAGTGTAPMRINYVRIKLPDVIRNLKIAVHGVYLPFPRIQPTAVAAATSFDHGMWGGPADHSQVNPASACAALSEDGSCAMVPVPPVKANLEMEDHHGL
ncbi:Fasciclin-like arabinogalactan protein 21 [Linum grandiflorum]